MNLRPPFLGGFLTEEKAIKQQFHALTGLRGFAACWIAVGHTIYALKQSFPIPPLLEHELRLSWVAVEIFFVLSGFVMAHAHPDGASTLKSYAHFMYKRFARIYPLYIICLVISVAFVGAHGWGYPPTSGDYIKHVFLMQTWWNYSHFIWLDPSWSLSAEWGSYVLFPFFFLFMKLKTRSEVIAWLIMMTVGYIVFHMAFANNNMRMIVQCGVFRAAPCFAIGILLYRLKQLLPDIKGYYADLTALAFVASSLILYLTGTRGFLIFPLCVLLVFFLSYEKGIFANFLKSRSLLFLGTISYALYITHYLIYSLTFRDNAPWQYFPLLYAGMILVGWLAHIIIEKPFQKSLLYTPKNRFFS